MSYIQKYTGVPDKPGKKENSVWSKFLKAVLPWIARKWELGNDYLEARVEKEKNEAAKIKAETTLLKIQAEKNIREIIELTEKAKEDNSNIGSVQKPMSASELQHDIESLREKLKMMRLKYGSKFIIFSIDEDSESGSDALEVE